jgi:hypothetical protein
VAVIGCRDKRGAPERVGITDRDRPIVSEALLVAASAVQIAWRAETVSAMPWIKAGVSTQPLISPSPLSAPLTAPLQCPRSASPDQCHRPDNSTAFGRS